MKQEADTFISQFIIKTLFLFACLCFLTNSMVAQSLYTKETCKERSGFEYGAIGGIYIAGNSSAEFYSAKPGNENYAQYVFDNKYWYDEIRELLDFNDTAFIREYPGKMGYSPAFSFGLFVQYNIDCKTGIYAQFYYVKLLAKDVITIEVDPKEYLTEPDIRLSPLRGVEERNLLDLGMTRAIGLSKTARLTLGAGISMNNTLVKEHSLYIADKKYNLVRVYGNQQYIPNGNQQAYDIRQGGIGFGIFATAGARIEFNPTVAIEPGVSFHYMKVNLFLENNKFIPQTNFYLKLIFRDLLNFNS